MSVRKCPFTQPHGHSCLAVVVEGGRPAGYHVLCHTRPILVCPHGPGWLHLTAAEDPASPHEVALVMAELACDPLGQTYMATWFPSPLAQEDIP